MTAADSVRDVLAQAIATLRETGVPDEAIGVLRSGRRLRKDLIEPAGRAWRLGVLLLGPGGELYETGTVTRAIDPPLGTANKSPEAEQRREDRRRAVRGGFAEGEVVNFGYRPVPLDEESLAAGAGPLAMIDGEAMVRWSVSGFTRLDTYLKERILLLTEG